MRVEDHTEEQKATAKRFCGKRDMVFYDEALQNHKVIHFGSGNVGGDGRLSHSLPTMEDASCGILCIEFATIVCAQEDRRVLAHFYTYEHFMDVDLDKYIKRFVRDYIHYRDEVGCRPPCLGLTIFTTTTIRLFTT